MSSWHWTLLLVSSLVGCRGVGVVPDAGGPPDARVSGTVGYTQGSALPPGAVLTVKLVDVSRADAAAVVLGEQSIQAEGRQPPFEFSIPYDPAKIDPRMRYAVQARIEVGGVLLFISDRSYPVLSQGAGQRVNLDLRAIATGR